MGGLDGSIGVVRVEAAVAVVDQARVAEVAVVAVTGGPTSRNTLTTHLLQSVKNITFLGNPLTGVRNRLLVLGRTFGSRRVNNETGTSLILMTFRTYFIMTSRRKYMPPLI